MHLYLNYAREHWALPGENPPVGLILCAEKDNAVAKYALEGLCNKVLAAEYRMTLPRERLLVKEIERSRRQLDTRGRNRLAAIPQHRRNATHRSKQMEPATTSRPVDQGPRIIRHGTHSVEPEGINSENGSAGDLGAATELEETPGQHRQDLSAFHASLTPIST